MVISNHSLFVGHGFWLQAGARSRGDDALRYHMYLNPDQTELKDSVALTYGTQLGQMAALLKPDAGKDGDSKKENRNGKRTVQMIPRRIDESWNLDCGDRG